MNELMEMLKLHGIHKTQEELEQIIQDLGSNPGKLSKREIDAIATALIGDGETAIAPVAPSTPAKRGRKPKAALQTVPPEELEVKKLQSQEELKTLGGNISQSSDQILAAIAAGAEGMEDSIAYKGMQIISDIPTNALAKINQQFEGGLPTDFFCADFAANIFADAAASLSGGATQG